MKFRNEYKHYISKIDAEELRKRLCLVAKKDEYTNSGGRYLIKSLYFDNYLDKVLREKKYGFDKREKFRIRFYNDDPSFIRLEKKSKINGFCIKQNSVITQGQTLNIIYGDTDWMKNSEEELIKELWAKMKFELLRPKNIVAYEREAYVYKPGNVRITIDSYIRGSDNVRAFFKDDLVMTKLFSESILEVKWDEFLPQIIRDVVQVKNVKTSNFSKYAATRFSAY